MTSLRWFFHDPSRYKDPMTFNPDRFMSPNPEPDVTSVFGFGRRICPGRYLADTSAYLTIAQSLALFNISRGVDKTTGQAIENKVEFTPGVISHPVPYETTIKPRSKDAEELLNDLSIKYSRQEGDGQYLSELSSVA